MLKKENLIQFEHRIAKLFENGQIKASVHLRSGCEESLINIFSGIRESDYVFSYWASHLHCLLKNVPEAMVLEAILEGRSISLCFPDYRIYASGIVGSLSGVAVGTALAIQRQKLHETVYLFTGDMGAEGGAFFEAVKYAYNFDLPIKFVIEDNQVSVLTPTREVWGSQTPWFVGTRYESMIIYYQYVNGWPHSGIGKRIAF